MARRILHVDMDAFYASVEVLDNPELAGRAVIVGGSPDGRGVVSSPSYEARRYGVHSAMPTAKAKRLCPHGVFLPVRMSRYAEMSGHIHAVFRDVTPLVEPLSLDEAFLDVTGTERLHGSAETVGRRIKDRIRNELGLVASVGVAANKFLAKLASDLDKPDGFVVVPDEDVEAFLAPLSVGRLWGVGKVSRKAFDDMGVTTIGQVQQLGKDKLVARFGRSAGEHIRRLARGLDERDVVPDGQAKSISSETTFAADIGDLDTLDRILLGQCEQVAWRLRRSGLAGRTVQIKARYGDFTTITRAESLANPTDVTDDVWQTARRLLHTRVDLRRGALRLLGVGVSGLAADSQRQLDLFDDGRTDQHRRVDSAVDEIRDRFGKGAVKRGTLLDGEDDS